MMRKQYTSAFKAKVVQEILKEEKTLAQIASEYEVHPTQLKSWRTIALEGLPSLHRKNTYKRVAIIVKSAIAPHIRLTTIG
jgi:putative transposase